MGGVKFLGLMGSVCVAERTKEARMGSSKKGKKEVPVAAQEGETPVEKKKEKKPPVGPREVPNKVVFREISIHELVKADWNYKVEDDFTQEKLDANLLRNGQLETLLVRRLENGKYEVVNGNHRLSSLLVLGVDMVKVFDLGVIPDAEARRLAIEVNETRFQGDTLKLARLIDELKVTYGQDNLLETMPYDRRGLDRLSGMADWYWKKEVPQLAPKSQKTRTEAQVVIDPVLLSFSAEEARDFRSRIEELRTRRPKATTEEIVLDVLKAFTTPAGV